MIPEHLLNTITTGDARELTKAIPDSSVDMVFCDPVYWNIEDYLWVALLAKRVLKEGGNLLAQCGSEYRFRAEQAMAISGLTMRPLLVEVYTGGFMQMWKHHSLNGYAPYVWMTKGDVITREGWVHSIVQGGGKNKATHSWGDSPDAFIRWTCAMTQRGDVVLDPFTGGGTVPAVCKMLGRQYIAFEIDPDTAERARLRVLQTQPPLPGLEVEQAVMELGA